MKPCPTDAQLVEYCRSPEPSDHSTSPVGRHVAACARCRQEVAALRAVSDLLRTTELTPIHQESACLDDLAIAALAEDSLDSVAREPLLHHLLACDHCSQRLADVSRMLRDEQVTAEIRKVEAAAVESHRGGRWLRAAGGLAAAAVLVLLVRSIAVPRIREPVQREEPVTLISAPVPIRPVGAVERVDSLAWHTVPRATQYRLTVFTREGETVWDSGTSDTVVALPRAVHLLAGATYYWKVEARTDWNRWTGSEMVEIRVRGN